MEGFSYSKANKEKAVHWAEDTLYDYLLVSGGCASALFRRCTSTAATACALQQIAVMVSSHGSTFLLSICRHQRSTFQALRWCFQG